MLVVRPDHDARVTPETVRVDSTYGIDGDHWSRGEYADQPDMQITLISGRILDLIAGVRDRWALAGDNIVVDLDLSMGNLPAGQLIAIGSSVLEISDVPHRGCAKFSRRFGADALRFVNLGDGPRQRLRGVYATAVQPGAISVGDVISKI